jgi:3-mercaptopyruvate sulfurtransferase SseA
VVEVDVSGLGYDEWHIDGAVLWNVYTDLKDADYRLADAAAVARLLARSGIRPDATVVGDPGTTLVDVRSAAEYQGERFWPSGGQEPGGRAGHVPTAVHQASMTSTTRAGRSAAPPSSAVSSPASTSTARTS